VGLSAVKGLAEAAGIPVVAVSRLEVLAAKAGVPSAALDAHRHEVFLRIGLPGEPGKEMQTDEGDRVPPVPILGPGNPYPSTSRLYRELLAGAYELADLVPPPRIALCDEAAAVLLGAAWPAAELVRTQAPTAADALRLCAPRVLAGEFVDLALLDGHYLRRSDAEIFGAEIFGEPATAPAERP